MSYDSQNTREYEKENGPLEKQASSEIAQSRERPAIIDAIKTGYWDRSLSLNYFEEIIGAVNAIRNKAERDTRERCAQIARSYAELCGLMTERGKMCSELAERIRGKE